MPEEQQTSAGLAPKLSVIIPAYNRPDMLAETLASLRDVIVDTEIVVVDDASPTSLQAVVEAQILQDPRIRYARNETNVGLPRNFNLAVDQARGEYVCMLGDDDASLPGNFEQKVAILDAHPQVGLVYSLWSRFNEKDETLDVCRWPGLLDHSYVGARREFFDLLPTNYISLHSTVFRRSLWEQLGGFDERFRCLSDWDLLLRYCRNTETAFLAEPLLKIRVHPDSDTQSTCVCSGGFVADKTAVWRKWLIDNPNPPMLDEYTWEQMARSLDSDVVYAFGADSSKRASQVRLVQDLYEQHRQRASEAVTRLTPSAPSSGETFSIASPIPRRPKLSILVPAYNRPDMLSETLASLSTVTSDCEIVVVDDNSPTDLGPVVERHAARDPRIAYVRNQENLGPTGNFNHAISLARGHYFCILGDDDTVLPGNFEKKLAILDAHPEIGFVYSRHYYTNQQNQVTGLATWQGMVHYSYIGGRNEFGDLFPWNYISLHSVVYRKELWERFGGFDQNITECGNDWELNLRYAFSAQTAYIDEPLLNVRLHTGTTTSRLGRVQQQLATGRIQVWRKWLVDADAPPVLDGRTWARIHALFVRDVNFWFKGQPELIQSWLTEFDRLHRDARAAASKSYPLKMAPVLAGHRDQAPNIDPQPAPERPPATGQSIAPMPIMWEGGFFETHSMALVNRELALAALATGEIDLSIRLRMLEPLRFNPQADARLSPLLAAVDRPLDRPPAVHIRHAWPPVFERPPHGKWVMVQPWEYGALPAEWVAPMRDAVDEIWVPSQIVRTMYIESGVPGGKIFVIPNGVDVSRFNPNATPLSLATTKHFRFLFVGGTIWRKGIDLLLEAYRHVFTKDDDVCLVIKDMGQDSYYKGQGAGETIARLKADPAAPEILYLTDPIPDDQIPGLYTACQSLVHPYRGEGFGLPVAEAMASGLAVIVTRGGSTDDFCSVERAFLIPSSRKPINIGKATAGQPWVLEADGAALAARMRGAYEDPNQAATIGRRAAEWARHNLTWEAAADTAMERLRILASNGPASAEAHAPWPLATQRKRRLLAWPNWKRTDLQDLLALIREAGATADPDFCLCLRLDPDRDPLQEIAIEMLGAAAAAALLADSELELLVVDDPIPEKAWPSLGAAVEAVIALDAPSDHTRSNFLRSLGKPLLANASELAALLGRERSLAARS